MFYPRNILADLQRHLAARQVTVLTGMRRTGKTTLVKALLDGVGSQNKLYFDLERTDNRLLFSEQNYDNIVLTLEARGISFKKKVYLAIDEIQLLPGIVSVIKYLYDNYPIKFIVTGSSSYYLKGQFTESLAGRKKLFELATLSFGEFLTFKEVTHSPVKFPIAPFLHAEYERLKRYYEEYIRLGGFPEVALARTVAAKKDLVRDILDSYIRIDVRTFTDFTNIQNLYTLLKMLSSRAATRLDYSKVASLSGLSRPTVYNYFNLFEHTYLIRRIPVVSKSSDREIVKAPKLFFTDNGILNTLGELDSGVQFENAVFNQLLAKGAISYYSRKTGKEIDFILNNGTAFEAKETPGSLDLKKLRELSRALAISKNYVVFRHPPRKVEKNFLWAGDVR
jgi:predicted AAA+ superfamily ATPase